MTGILSVLLLCLGGYKELKFDWRDPILLPILTFIAFAISLIYTSDTAWGLELLFRQNAYVVLPIIILINRRLFLQYIETYLDYFIVALAISGIIAIICNWIPQESLQSITKSTGVLQEYSVREKRMNFGGYSPFVDRLRFCYLIGTGTLLLIWQIASGRKSIMQFILLGILLLTQLLLGARGAQLALLASIGLWVSYYLISIAVPMLLIRIGKWSAYSAGIVLFAGAIIGGPILIAKTVPSVNARYKQMQWEIERYQSGQMTQSTTYDYTAFTSIRRIHSWKNTWEIIKRQPILGVGIGDYESELDAQYQKDGYDFPPNSHQQFLHHWLVSGLLGLLSLLILFGGFMKSMHRNNASVDRMIGYTFMLFFGITFLFDIPLWYQTSRVGFLMILGMLLLVGEREVISLKK